MTDNDFETAPLGTIKALDDKDMEIQRLREAIREAHSLYLLSGESTDDETLEAIADVLEQALEDK